jgi:hypothetical protein
VLEELIDSQLPAVPVFLEKWREKEVWQRESDGRFFFVEDAGDGKMTLIDVDSGAEAGLADQSDLDNLKPNSGVRGVIAGVLVQFQLSDPDPERRLQALTALERDPEASHLSILRGAIESETDPAIKARKERLQRLLTIQFGSDQANRVAAIESFAGDPGGRLLPVRRSGARRAVAGVDLLPGRHRACHHLRGDGRDQHGPWRVHHDRRLYRLCRAAVHPQLHVSIIVALPLAFTVAFLAGVALERLVIRYLAHRPLETLLATFGISIALQQIAKNIFGTQARPLTSPSWLDGAWVLNDVVSISYIRIAIFVLALPFWACCCSFSTARGSGLRCGR